MKILLVEDHDDTRKVLGKILEKRGYEVYPASCGKDALALGKVYPFDLIIMDHGLPGEDGCEIMEKLCRIKKTKGIAVTANAYPIDKQRSKKAGFLAHLTKPVAADKLCEVIETVLGKRK